MRVVVADDALLTREGIVRLLRDANVEVVAEADDAQGLLHQVRLARPDVALVDIRMPPTHTDEGLVAAQTIRAEHPQVGVLVLSQYVEPSYALRLIQEQPEPRSKQSKYRRPVTCSVGWGWQASNLRPSDYESVHDRLAGPAECRPRSPGPL